MECVRESQVGSGKGSVPEGGMERGVQGPELLDLKDCWPSEVGFWFGWCCVESGDGLCDPCGSHTTWNVLWHLHITLWGEIIDTKQVYRNRLDKQVWLIILELAELVS